MSQRFPVIFLAIFAVVFFAGATGGFLAGRLFVSAPQSIVPPAPLAASSPVPEMLLDTPLITQWSTTITEAAVRSVGTNTITIEEQGSQLILPMLEGNRLAGVDRISKEGRAELDVMAPFDIAVGTRVSVSIAFTNADTFWVSRILILP